MDKIIEITKLNWFERLKKALGGLIFAPLFVLLGFWLLKSGEKDHAASTTKLKSVASAIVDLKSAAVGDLTYIQDSIKAPKTPLTDPETGFSFPAIKIFRKVYTYQWIEHVEEKEKTTITGGEEKEKIYTYFKGWDNGLWDTRKFKYPDDHENPKSKKFSPKTLEHKKVAIGGYELGPKLYQSLYKYEPVDLTTEVFVSKKVFIDTCLTENLKGEVIKGLSKANYADKNDLITKSVFYCKEGKSTPQVGDTRVEYWYIPDGLYSVVGQISEKGLIAQKSDSLFIHSELSEGGTAHTYQGSFGMVFTGDRTLEDMFSEVHYENDKMFIIMRFIGLLFVVAGFLIFGAPLQLLFSWIPFIGKIWERIIFKLMQVIGTAAALSISIFYFFKYNTLSNLSLWDLYFVFGVILFIFFVHRMSASVKSNGNTIYSDQF